MARKLVRIGGLYLAYEIISTAGILALLGWGINVPGF